VADEVQRYRQSIGWLILGRATAAFCVASLGVGVFRAISSGLDSIDVWWTVGFPVTLLAAARRWTYELVVDPDRGTLTFRRILGRTRVRALADLRGVKHHQDMVSFVFDRRTNSVDAGPRAEELAAQVRRLRPDLADPAVRAFTIVLRGYDRAQVDTYLGQAQTGGDARPTFPVVLRGYDRAQVDRAVAELTSDSGSGG
jgi:DivIVA domain-containing protein